MPTTPKSQDMNQTDAITVIRFHNNVNAAQAKQKLNELLPALQSTDGFMSIMCTRDDGLNKQVGYIYWRDRQAERDARKRQDFSQRLRSIGGDVHTNVVEEFLG